MYDDNPTDDEEEQPEVQRYNDIFSAPERTQRKSENESRDVTVWGLGDHDEAPDVDIDWSHWDRASSFLKTNMPSLYDALNFAKEEVEEIEVSGYECPVCGLVHEHSDNKHDIRSIFNVRQDFAERMEMCPYCHCGVNELARLVQQYDSIHVPVFTDEDDLSYAELTDRFDMIQRAANKAPIPDETQQQLNETLGTL